ncbi:hypothetical protein [Halobacterium salinarum]|uniref:hypothetical protein n=1 Tax=Halobacterium salinarum TaxID=2242 RepID=UPI00255681C1|nr:hypothetical protein [Halobacterium salinarum]MDL0128086.1 hypothetical protein [Halobacterium salinarum]
MFWNVYHIELAPPLWHTIGKVLTIISPAGDIITIRIFNYILYLSLIPLGYLSGSELAGRPGGIGAALILPLSQRLLQYVTRPDHYMLFATLSLVYVFFAFRVVSGSQKYRDLVGLAMTVPALALVHYYGLILGAVFGVLGLFYSGVKNRWLRKGDWNNQQVLNWTVCHSTVVLAPILFHPYYISHITRTGGSTIGPGYSLQSLLGYYPILQIDGFSTSIAITMTIGLILLGAMNTNRRSLFAFPIIGVSSLLAVAMFRQTYHPRHLFFFTTLIPLLIGASLGSLFCTARDAVTTKRMKTAVVIALVVCSTAVIYVDSTTEYQKVQTETGTEKAAKMVEQNVTDSTIVLAVTPMAEMTLRTYQPGLGVPIYGMTGDGNQFDLITSSGKVLPRRYITGNSTVRPSSPPTEIGEVDRIIVYLAHGYTESRYGNIPPLLYENGYHQESSKIYWNNGVEVFDKNGTEMAK